MLGDYRKTFNKDDGILLQTPASILDFLNQNVQGESTYYDLGNGFCALNISPDATVSGNFYIDGASDDKMNQCNSFDDYYFYATNLQKRLSVGPDDEGYITIDGKKYTLDQLFISTFQNIERISGAVFIDTPVFDKEFNIKFECSSSAKIIKMKRVVYDSVEEIKFESAELGALYISLVGPRKVGNAINVKVNINIKDARSIQDVYDAMLFYNDIAQGRVSLYGARLYNSSEGVLEPFDKDVLGFWKTLLELETLTKKKFDTKETMTVEDVEFVRELKRSLIDKLPTKENGKINFIDGEMKACSTSQLDDMVGKNMLLKYTERATVIFMGAEIALVRLRYVFNVKVTHYKISEDNKSYKIYLDDAEGSKMYISSMFFLDETSLEKFDEDTDFKFDLFKNADILPRTFA